MKQTKIGTDQNIHKEIAFSRQLLLTNRESEKYYE